MQSTYHLLWMLFCGFGEPKPWPQLLRQAEILLRTSASVLLNKHHSVYIIHPSLEQHANYWTLMDSLHNGELLLFLFCVQIVLVSFWYGFRSLFRGPSNTNTLTKTSSVVLLSQRTQSISGGELSVQNRCCLHHDVTLVPQHQVAAVARVVPSLSNAQFMNYFTESLSSSAHS